MKRKRFPLISFISLASCGIGNFITKTTDYLRIQRDLLLMFVGYGFFVAGAAEGFVGVGLAKQDTFVGRYQTVAHVCQIAAMDADSMGLIYVVGYCH